MHSKRPGYRMEHKDLSRNKSQGRNSEGNVAQSNQEHHHSSNTRKNRQHCFSVRLRCWICKAVNKVGITNMSVFPGFFGNTESKSKKQINCLIKMVARLETQVARLETQAEQQQILAATYKFRLGKVQDYLRYCLQIATEHGFIHLIGGDPGISKEEPSDDFSSYVDCRLISVYEQARQNGWHVNKYEIQIHELVGKGTTADIFRGTWRGMDVAVKCIRPDFFEQNEEGVDWFCQELEMLSRQRHPYVLHLMGACLSPPDNAWIVTELLTSRTLTDWLHGKKQRQRQRTVPLPSLPDRLRIAMEIAQAMQYLHDQKPKVLHRDLKPSNIFLDDRHHVRVADFGHARFLPDGELALTGETGTYVYMAPEVIKCEPYDEKCDVYSYGVILCELLTGQPPYIDSTYYPQQIANEVAAGNLRPTLPHDNATNNGLIDLICYAWDQDPSNRPSFATITCTLRNIQREILG